MAIRNLEYVPYTINHDVTINGDLTTSGTVTNFGDVTVSGNLVVTGSSNAVIGFTTVGDTYLGNDVSDLTVVSGTFIVHNTSDTLFVSGNKVGIGTTSPSSLLHIYGADPVVYIHDSESQSDLSQAFLKFSESDASGNTEATYRIGQDSRTFRIAFSSDDNNGVGTYTDLITVDEDGKVGIGTDSPSEALEVYGTTTAISIKGNSATAKDQATLKINGLWGDSSIAALGIVLSSNGTVDTLDDTYRFQVYDGTGWKVPLLFYKNGDVALSASDAGTNPIMFLEDSSSNVGIGTTSPNQLLTLQSSGNTSQGFIGVKDSDGNYMFTVESDSSGYGFVDIRDTSGNTKVRLNSGGDTYFTGGDVGIGTTNPTATRGFQSFLEIAGPAPGIGLSQSTDNVEWSLGVWSGTNARFLISRGSSEYLTIKSDGKVGIGTDSPDAKLHVSGGDILIDNNYYLRAKDSGGTARLVLGFDANNNFYLGNDYAGGDTYIRAYGSGNALVIKATTGNVGIGTDNPDGLLELQKTDSNTDFIVRRAGTNSSTFKIKAQANLIRQTFSGDLHFDIDESGTTALLIQQSTGNIGIGTNDPQTLLSLPNDEWISGENNAGTGVVNMWNNRS